MDVERVDANTLIVRIASEGDTARLGRALAGVVEAGVVIGLVGTLGAGKTRLVRAMAEALGVDPGAIASPTFVLIHEYEGTLPISHFDAYRLAGPDEFDALGASDHWAEGGRLALIEWADLVADRLPGTAWWVRIEVDGPEGRIVRVECPQADRLADLLGASGSSTVRGAIRPPPPPLPNPPPRGEREPGKALTPRGGGLGGGAASHGQES